jgi:glycosyltransferase involved in cell wall biosynthesis
MYLMDYFYETTGGTEGQLLQLIMGLDRRLFIPHLFVLRSTAFTDNNRNFPCPITTVGIEKIRDVNTFIKLLRFSQFIRVKKFKLIHIFFNDASLIAPLFCKIGGAKVIVSRRDMGFWYTSLNLKILPFSNYFVDTFIANSNVVKQNVNKFEKYPLEKIEVLYNGFNFQRLVSPPLPKLKEQLGISADDPIIGMVANLNRMKRHSDLIRAFSIVHQNQKNVHLILLGTGVMESSLKELTYSLNLNKNVHFLGSVNDVIPIVKHFSIGILCSESEGLSNAIIEYMACGIPTICTSVGGNPELITDNYNGFLVEVGDIEKLADRMMRILSDPSLGERLGNNARAMIKQKFSSKDMVNSHMQIYEKLLSRRSIDV